MPYIHNKRLTPNAKILRKNMTEEEKRLWYDFLRTYPIRFLRQKVIGNSIVDFYCHKAKVVIEIDGSQHYTDDGIMNDIARTKYLDSLDLLVVRIDNLWVNRNLEGMYSYRLHCKRASAIPPPLTRSPSL